MKKIFISIPWFHPAFRAGGPVQSVANLVNEFNNEVEYNVFCADTDLNNTTLENIETGTWVPYNDHCMVWYAGGTARSETILKQIEAVNPDTLYIIGIFSWYFNIVPVFFSKHRRKIVSVRGMLHPGALSQKTTKKRLYLKLWKLFGLHKKVSFHATDETEKKYIQQVFGNEVNIFVAGNFPRKFSPVSTVAKTAGSIKLLSIALISPMKNHLLVLQALGQCSGSIEYNICGPVKDMEYWQQCLEQIKKLPPNIIVHYHGDIQPSAVGAYLNDSHVFILPSKSENFGHAFYEALSAGKPVITSMHTPWKELGPGHAGINVELDIHSIKNAIDQFVVMGEDEYGQWVNAAMLYAEKAIDMGQVKQQYAKMFLEKEVTNH